MFRTLVVPLDGSSLAEHALPYAIRLAQSGLGRLILMRATLAPAPRTLDGSDWERDQAQAIAEAEQYLRDMAASVSGQVPVETVAVYGRAAPQILETARSFKADAVVMATRAQTGLPHLIFGSVTESVLANCIVPVFVVHPRADEAPAPSFAPYSARVLVPQDGSAYDAVALHAAVEVLEKRGEIVLMTVIAPAEHVKHDEYGRVVAYLDQQEEWLSSEARDYLEGVAIPLRNRPLPIKVTTDVRFGDPAAGITLGAAEQGADFIVMATHGRTGVRRAVVGSVAGEVLRTGSKPVLLVHPHVLASSTHNEQLEAAIHA